MSYLHGGQKQHHEYQKDRTQRIRDEESPEGRLAAYVLEMILGIITILEMILGIITILEIILGIIATLEIILGIITTLEIIIIVNHL